MRRWITVMAAGALLGLSCQFLPFGKIGSSDTKFSASASKAKGHDIVEEFVVDMKKGKENKALKLLAQEDRDRWQLRAEIMRSSDKKSFMRQLSKDHLEVDYDQGKFTVVGVKTAPTEIKAVKRKGKWRLEF